MFQGSPTVFLFRENESYKNLLECSSLFCKDWGSKPNKCYIVQEYIILGWFSILEKLNETHLDLRLADLWTP